MVDQPDHQLHRRRLLTAEGVELLRVEPTGPSVAFRTAEWTLLSIAADHPQSRLRVTAGQRTAEAPCAAGVLVLLPPHQRCRLESDAALTLDLLLFSRFAVERATKSFGALAEIPRPSFDPRGATWVTRLWHDEEPDGHVPCLLRWLAHRSTLATSLPNPADSIGPGTLRALEAQLEEQIARPLDFAALAETAGLPREPFSRAFKAVLGLAPTRYFTRLRVELAAHRLHHRGSINLDRIALDMGFYDQSHMNRQFKRLLGITPGEYRRQI